jgi:hypothetical protein
MYENTLFIFVGDNGGDPKVGGYNYPLRGTKGAVPFSLKQQDPPNNAAKALPYMRNNRMPLGIVLLTYHR